MINIAIDGPAGAGKSTIAKELAKKLSFIYVDTGAMYRAFALACIRNGISEKEKEKVIEVCRNTKINIEYVDNEQCILLDGSNVNQHIRTGEVSRMASAISAYPEVRGMLLNLQRELARKNNVIMDGRDIGTAVLPDADVKIYLTADSKVRAQRRYIQMENTEGLSLNQIQKEIEERDYRDMNRETAPLKRAEDAVLVDTSDMSEAEVVSKILDTIKWKAGLKNGG